MKDYLGKLIALEGIDQSGKRTQARLLAHALRAQERSVSLLSFPDYGTPLGRQLKAYLSRRREFDYHVVHMLYAMNRWERSGEIVRYLRQGRFVIVNRYSPSNLAYGVAHGLSVAWLASLEEGLPKPDAIIVLDVAPQTSFKRKSQRRDIHEEDLLYLKNVRKVYNRLGKKYGWVIINGENDSNKVQADLWKRIERAG
jgi:dTMP kinase